MTGVMTDGADDEPWDAMAHLEEEIEALAHRAARCERIALLAKLTTAAGALLLALLVLGLLRDAPLALVGGLSALLGGLALLGTNSGTREEIGDALADCEARRNDLIASRNPRPVPRDAVRELGGRREASSTGEA